MSTRRRPGRRRRSRRRWALVAAAAVIASALVVLLGIASSSEDPPSLRPGGAALFDQSCDRPDVGPAVPLRLRAILGPTVDAKGAVAIWYAGANAYSSRDSVLDLTEAEPTDADRPTADAWQRDRVERFNGVLAKFPAPKKCLMQGTSFIGSVRAGKDLLDDAGVDGPRTIFYFGNGVENTEGLIIDPRRFGPDNVEAAYQAIAALGPQVLPRLGPETTLVVLLSPVQDRRGVQVEIPEAAALAIEQLLQRVGEELLGARTRVEILPVS